MEAAVAAAARKGWKKRRAVLWDSTWLERAGMRPGIGQWQLGAKASRSPLAE